MFKAFHMQPQRAIVAFAVAVSLVLIALVGFDLRREYLNSVEAASAKTQSLTILLEEHARQSLRRVDLAMLQASEELNWQNLQNPWQRETERQRLIGHIPTDQLIGSFAVVDRNGKLLVSTPVVNPDTLPDVSDRDYFVQQRQNPSATLRIGAMSKSRITGRWIVPVSKALFGPQGQFQGVLMATLEPEYLQRFYDSIDSGTNGFVTLFTREAWIIARSPFNEATVSRNWADSPMFSHHLQHASADTVRQVVASDGVERMYSYRALADYPVVVALGVSMTDGLSAWRRRVVIETLLLSTVLLLTLAAMLVILRQLRQAAKTETALKLSEFSVQAASLATFWIAKDARILRVNQAACDLHGYSREQLLTMSITDMDPDYPTERWPEHWAELRAAKHMTFETQHRAADGRMLPMEVEINYIEFEGEEYNFSFMRDISERLKAEQELRRSESMLRDAIDAVDEAFVLFDPDDCLVYCNDKYRYLYPGMEDLMVPGTHFDTLVHRGAQLGLYRESQENKEEWIARRIQAHRDGHTVRVQQNANGQVLRVIDRRTAEGYTVGFRVDITEQVRATEAAQEASRYKSQFLANMSHEIRTPMNAILGLLNLLQSTPLDARQQDYTNKTEVAAKSLLGLLNDILDFSKVEAGKMVLDPHPFRLDRMLRDISVVLSSTIGSKSIEVLFDLEAKLPPVLMGDSMRLQQVLINLGSNAVKFTASGQVLLKVSRKQESESADQSDAVIEFQVQDSGIGIAMEDQERIFSGFSQAEASTTRRFGGTGLGLAICKRLVEMMGGELQLHSAPGSGSTFAFSLRFPVVAAPPPGLLSRPRPAVARKRVLVVDNNAVARELMQRIVRSWGWDCESADSAMAALQAIEAGTKAAAQVGTEPQFPFDVIYLDWQMPQMDGWEAAQRIRALAAPCSNAPVLVMMTANSRDTLAVRTPAEQALVNAFLFKPMTASMLYDAAIGFQVPDARLQQAGGSSARRLSGMRILVVEDNLINQQVAEELLNREGAIVVLAANGQLGVEAVAAASPQFDAVLMDLQMPVLDGYGATQRIREEMGLTRLPIIAMTANALASDRAACLAAGMMDHVGKPFELNHLVSVLLAATGRELQADAGPQESKVGAHEAQTPPAQQAPYNELLDVPTALGRISGMESLYVRLARDFCDELTTVMQHYAELAQSGDSAAMTLFLHSLKGAASTLGAMPLSTQAASLEKLSRGPTAAFAPADHAQALEAVVQPTHAALQAAIAALHKDDAEDSIASQLAADAQTHTGEADAEKRTQARQVLYALMGLLRANDLTALEQFANSRSVLAALPMAEMETLEAALSGLDFEQAHRLCAQMCGDPGPGG